MTEAWKPVVGWEGRYEVSDQGRVRSLLRKEHRILRPGVGAAGYACVILCPVKGKKMWGIAELVLTAFDRPRPDGHQVDHLNADRLDDRLVNLEWVTPRENTRRRAFTKLTSALADEIRTSLREGVQGKELAAAYGVSMSCVSLIKLDRLWKEVE